jgi:uncharacterized DUF497 family protein
MRYDWIESKRAANLAKHGIDFADVAPVFESRMVVANDTRENYDPPRTVGIGTLNGRTVVVVWAETKDTRWIISARRANEKERKRYDAAP